jgi:DNA-binding MarR family transcriptional regulator
MGNLMRSISWMSKIVENGLNELNLSLSQLRILLMLASGEQASTFLAKKLLVKPSSVTAVIDNLVQKELVIRSSDRQDRRLVKLAISPKGLETLTQVEKEISERLNVIFAGLNEYDTQVLNKSAQIILRELSTRFEKRLSVDGY